MGDTLDYIEQSIAAGACDPSGEIFYSDEPPYDCDECGDGDALRPGEACAYCGLVEWTDEQYAAAAARVEAELLADRP